MIFGPNSELCSDQYQKHIKGGWMHDFWPQQWAVLWSVLYYPEFGVYTVCPRKKLSKFWRHVAQKVTRIWQYTFA